MKLRLLLFSVLVLIWLAPFFWAGAKGQLPVKVHPRLSFQYNAAGLFTRRTSTWTQMLIQVQRKGAPEWQTIDTAEVSPMGAFGYRQRLDRILQETNGRRAAEMVRRRMAVWVAARYGELHPDEGEVVGVRFGQTVWAANSPEMAKPAGHWVRRAPAPIRSLAAYVIAGGVARLMVDAPAPRLAPNRSKVQPMRVPAAFERKGPEPAAAGVSLPAVRAGKSKAELWTP